MSSPLVPFGLRLLAVTLLAGVAHAQYLDVSAGLYHSVALRCDGTVEFWGDCGFVPACEAPDLPPGVTTVAVAAGGSFDYYYEVHAPLSLALRSDGSVVAWGPDNTSGQLAVPALPPGLTFVEVAAGPRHALARRSDGTVVAWGDGSSGQLAVPALPPGVTYVEIAAGGWTDIVEVDPGSLFGTITITYAAHSVARRSDGSVVAWGSNSHGQSAVPAPPPGLTYTAVAAGSDHTVGLLSDGTVVAWGDDTFGQCSVPALPPGRVYVEVAAGGGTTAARLDDGSVISWGGGLGTAGSVPALPAGVTYTDIAAGGEVVRWMITQSIQPSTFTVSADGQHNLALRSDGAAVGWGEGALSPFGEAIGYPPPAWSFADLGQGLAGTSGMPLLVGGLVCSAGPQQVVSLTLSGAPPDSVSTLVIGLSPADLPLLGGTLVPALDVLLTGLPLDARGVFTAVGRLPLGVPSGTEFFFQHWVTDDGAPAGFAASNGVRLTAP